MTSELTKQKSRGENKKNTNMKQINVPIHIEVQNNKIFAIWYTDDYGQDALLDREDYSVEYRTVPKEEAYPILSSENWLKPKLWKPSKEEKGDEK